MSKDNLPGIKEVTELLGYELSSYTADGATAYYSKGELTLKVSVFTDESKIAMLFALRKLVRINVGPFSFPNKNFEIFEKQLLDVIQIPQVTSFKFGAAAQRAFNMKEGYRLVYLSPDFDQPYVKVNIPPVTSAGFIANGPSPSLIPRVEDVPLHPFVLSDEGGTLMGYCADTNTLYVQYRKGK